MKDGKTGDNGENLNSHIRNEEYLTCIKIWNELVIMIIISKKMLFADAFETFIYMCLNFYKLDSCHYFSSSGVRWNALLKMTGVK